MKNLVIVESPTKSRTISKFLGKDYEIRASMGHIMDLPKSKLGVDVTNNFSPEYEFLGDKKKIVAELKNLAKTAEIIILATDPDREGEAIASHVKDVLSSKSKTNPLRQLADGGQNSKFKRIVFHEITKEAIEEALQNPRDIDTNLVDAQTARRVLDRLVGYKLSPILWKKVRRGLSAGRVQSVALRLIVEREREIDKFSKEQYYTITALLENSQKKEVAFELFEINGEKIELQKTFDLYDGQYRITKTIIENEEKAKVIIEDVKNRKFIVRDVLKKETHRSPQPPFITSTLQQEAARRFGYSGRKTMSLAQKLYEEGFITYHRTDSVILSQSAIAAIRGFVKKTYGDNFLPEQSRYYKTKQKLAQEAHEAIRPTNMTVQSHIVEEQIGRDYSRVYDLIWKRAIASQMKDAVIESTTVIADTAANSLYTWKANGSVLVFEGFLKVNPQALQDTQLPEFTVKENLQAKNTQHVFHETPPPPRYNDASLIKTLEEKGIGRPSTYAAIITTIEVRKYVERLENRFEPTTIGTAVNDFLVKNFSTIDDIPFTVAMEDQLDEIAQGKKEWVPMMKEFFTPFSQKLTDVEKGAERVKIEVEATDEICEKCGAPVVIRMGRFGKFYSCSRFPECDFAKPFVQETNFTCPKDEAKIIVKKTRKGRRFYGCSNYPKCNFAAWKIEDINKNSKFKNQKSKNKRETKKTSKK